MFSNNFAIKCLLTPPIPHPPIIQSCSSESSLQSWRSREGVARSQCAGAQLATGVGEQYYHILGRLRRQPSRVGVETMILNFLIWEWNHWPQKTIAPWLYSEKNIFIQCAWLIHLVQKSLKNIKNILFYIIVSSDWEVKERKSQDLHYRQDLNPARARVRTRVLLIHYEFHSANQNFR